MKIVFILPEFRNAIGTHFYHKYEFIKEASKTFDAYVLIEKGELPADVPNARVMRFRSSPLRALEYLVVLLRLRRRGYRVFWTHYAFLGGILAPLFGKSFYWNCGMPWLYPRGFFEERAFRLAMSRSCLVTGTAGLRSMYIKHYALAPERVFVLPNWINIGRFAEWRSKRKEARERLGIRESAKVVFFLHRLSKRKGADMIVPVAGMFSGDREVLFLVAGSGPLADSITGENIRCVGEIPHTEVPMYLAAADVFFMPSEEEGFPHVLLEAMAVGVPIVASDAGGVREIVPESFFDFVVEHRPEFYAQAIRMILGDSALQERLSEAGRAWVTQYALEIVYHKFKELVTR